MRYILSRAIPISISRYYHSQEPLISNQYIWRTVSTVLPSSQQSHTEQLAGIPEAPTSPFEVRRSHFVHTCSNLRAAISREKFSFSKIFKVHYSFSTFLVPLYNKVDPELIMFETLILSPRECREDPGTSMRIKSCTKIGEISLKAACAQSQTPKNIKFTQCTSLTSLTALPRLGHE